MKFFTSKIRVSMCMCIYTCAHTHMHNFPFITTYTSSEGCPLPWSQVSSERQLLLGRFCVLFFSVMSAWHTGSAYQNVQFQRTIPPPSSWFKWIAELAASHVPTVMMLLRTWAPRNSWMPSPDTLASGPDVWKEIQSRKCPLSYETLDSLSPGVMSAILPLSAVIDATLWLVSFVLQNLFF